MSSAWKRAERLAAKVLGGTRNSRGGDFGKSLPDVEHELFSVEVKYRAALPQLLRLGLEQAHSYDLTKRPLLVIKERYKRGALVVLALSDFEAVFGGLKKPPEMATPDPNGKEDEV